MRNQLRPLHSYPFVLLSARCTGLQSTSALGVHALVAAFHDDSATGGRNVLRAIGFAQVRFEGKDCRMFT